MELTLAEVCRDFESLAAAAREAAAQELRVGPLLGVGGYAAVFAADPKDEGPCVLKLPWVHHRNEVDPDEDAGAYGPNRVRLRSCTGPFWLGVPRSLSEAATLLTAACARQREQTGATRLARMLREVDLAGLPGALIERIEGPDLRRLMTFRRDDAWAALPRIAAALADLHETFGPHGDLKPEHVFFPEDDVKFIDPLCDADWVGSVGYTLGRPGIWLDGGKTEEARRLQDLAALAAIVLELRGTDPGWDARLAFLVANQQNGRFGRGLDWEGVEHRFLKAGSSLPRVYQAWTASVGHVYFAALRGGTLPQEGWCAATLAGLCMSEHPTVPTMRP